MIKSGNLASGPVSACLAVAAKAYKTPFSPISLFILVTRLAGVTKWRAEPPKRPLASTNPLDPGTKTKSPTFKEAPFGASNISPTAS